MLLIVVLVWAGASSALAAAPVALVEESSVDAVGIFDMLDQGRTIDLGTDGVLVLGYLQSCVHERIEGGLVTVGQEQSEVRKGKIQREKVDCGGGDLMLTAAQSQASGAIVLRSAAKPRSKGRLVHSTRPFLLTRSEGEVVLSRMGNPGDSHRLPAHCQGEGRCGVDLAETDLVLKPGASYRVRSGTKVVVFGVAADAADSTGAPPATILERLVFVR